MTYEEADHEAHKIISAIKVDGEKWHYAALRHRPSAYIGLVTLKSPVHPTTGKRGNWVLVIQDDDLKEISSISEKLNKGIDIIRRHMRIARENAGVVTVMLSDSSNP